VGCGGKVRGVGGAALELGGSDEGCVGKEDQAKRASELVSAHVPLTNADPTRTQRGMYAQEL
jgi:hypothetical protein